MPPDSAASTNPGRRNIGIECEALEGDSWGVSRMTRKLLERLALRTDLNDRWHFTLYFNRAVPADIAALDSSLFTTRVVGVPSFSLYYYLALPIRVWLDRPFAMYYPNYMLPIIHPPKVKSVVMLTEDIYREIRNAKLPFRYRLAYRVFGTGWAARRATRILAISESSRDALIREGIPAGRIAVNQLAVDDPVPVAIASAGAARSDVLFVGQTFERRHLRETLGAFSLLAGRDPNLTMRIIGPDKYEPLFVGNAVRQLNESLGRAAVRWNAHVQESELAAAYAGARAVAYVSDAEAFGLPPLEALSYGTVPVIIDAPVSREVFAGCASYTADGSVHAIADALHRALNDEILRSGIRSSAPTVLRRYRWDAHADRFLALMQSL